MLIYPKAIRKFVILCTYFNQKWCIFENYVYTLFNCSNSNISLTFPGFFDNPLMLSMFSAATGVNPDCQKFLTTLVRANEYIKREPNSNNGTPQMFSCERCGRSYKHKTSLYTHRKYECGNKKSFECPLCPYKSAQKISMKSHMQRKHSQGATQNKMENNESFNASIF